MNPDMVDRLAVAVNGGPSFTNEYAKRHLVRQVVRTLNALTDADVLALMNEKIETRNQEQRDRDAWAAAAAQDDRDFV